MQRGSSLEAVTAARNSSARATVESADDSKEWQELTHKGFEAEQAETIEHVHPYGITAVPLPPTGDSAAEAIIIYLGGDRSHGVAVVVGDRRYRLTGLQPGESALHDDQSQKVHVQRAGVRVASPDKAVSVVVDANSQHRVQANGYVLATVEDITKFKIQFGGQWWQLDPSALVPSTAPPADPTSA